MLRQALLIAGAFFSILGSLILWGFPGAMVFGGLITVIIACSPEERVR